MKNAFTTLAAFAAGVFVSLAFIGQVVETTEVKHVAAIGVALSLLTFLYNAFAARRQQRQQHTITILFQTRLSPEFRENLAKRKRYFPEGERVSHATYRSYLAAKRDRDIDDDEASRRRECAEAIRSLLNYYEFIALGVDRGDLDETMLFGSIRGIMCALVVDMADIIRGEREANPRAYANLVCLFARWRRHEPDPGLSAVAASRIDRLREEIARRIAP